MARRKNLQTLRGMNNAPRNLPVLRDGAWQTMSAESLLPGDIVSITRGPGVQAGDDVVPCDCLLIKGAAVVNEATLTGESVPQMKDPIVCDEDTENVALDIQTLHKAYRCCASGRVPCSPQATDAHSLRRHSHSAEQRRHFIRDCRHGRHHSRDARRRLSLRCSADRL